MLQQMSLEALIFELQQTTDWDAHRAIGKQIATFGETAVQPLIEILKLCAKSDDYFNTDHSKANLHSIAEDTLLEIGEVAIDALIPLLKSTNWGAIHGALYCLHHIGNPRVITILVEALDNEQVSAGEIAEALFYFGEVSINPLLEALNHKSATTRDKVVLCLRRFNDERIPHALINLVKRESAPTVRESIIFALDHYMGEQITQAIADLQNDPDSDVQEAAHDVLQDRNARQMA